MQVWYKGYSGRVAAPLSRLIEAHSALQIIEQIGSYLVLAIRKFGRSRKWRSALYWERFSFVSDIRIAVSRVDVRTERLQWNERGPLGVKRVHDQMPMLVIYPSHRLACCPTPVGQPCTCAVLWCVIYTIFISWEPAGQKVLIQPHLCFVSPNGPMILLKVGNTWGCIFCLACFRAFCSAPMNPKLGPVFS
jgi:hypothetical protein